MKKDIEKNAETVSPTEKRKIIGKVSGVSIWGNIILSVFKLLAGIFGHSGAMISDAVHSLSDVFTTVIAWIGVKISDKEADREHPYGHERIECVASILLAVLLCATGIGIGYSSVTNIISPDKLQVPSLIALIAAALSIVTKEGMYHYTMYYAKKINSSAFKADAWHHRSDALSSVGSLIGIGGAMLGCKILDPIAGVVICCFILKVAVDIFLDATGKMVDRACEPEFEKEIHDLILENPHVVDVDMLRTRKFGEKIYIEAEIGIDPEMKLKDAHEIAENVHDLIEGKYPEIKHITIHENPHAVGEDKHECTHELGH